MAVWLSKSIGVESRQLTWLLIAMKLGIVAGLLVQLVYFTSYAAVVDGSSLIETLLWTGLDPDDEMEEYSVDEALCDSATMWQKDYCFDSACVWSYVNNTCMPLCPPGRLSDECMTTDEGHTYSEMKDWVFWGTYLTQEFFSVGPEAKNVSSSGGAFVMGTHRRTVTLQYGYSRPEYVLYPEESPASTDRILTLLVDADGEVYDALEPSHHIRFSWTSLLAASGHRELMDSALAAAGENLLPGAFMPEGPLGRLAGLVLHLEIDCTNAKSLELTSAHDDWGGPICTMGIVLPKVVKPWPSFERTLPANAEQVVRRRYFHGIYIASHPTGEFYFFDFYYLYLWFLSGMVVMRVPGNIIRILSLYFLGHLSLMYKRVVLEHFCIVKELAVFASSLVANTHAFYGVSNGASLTMLRVAEWMAQTTANEVDLDMSEATDFVKTCYTEMLETGHAHTVARERASLCTSVFGELLDVGKTVTDDDEVGEDRQIDVYAWLRCMMASARITIPDLTKLFDKDRQRSCMELFFMPPKIRARRFGSVHSPKSLSRANDCEGMAALSEHAAILELMMSRRRPSLIAEEEETATAIATEEDQEDNKEQEEGMAALSEHAAILEVMMSRRRPSLIAEEETATAIATEEDQDHEDKKEQEKPEAQEEQEEQKEQEEQGANLGDVRADMADLRRQTWHTVHALCRAVRSLSEDVRLLKQAKEEPDGQLAAAAVLTPFEPRSALVGDETKRCLDELAAHLNALEGLDIATEALPRQQPCLQREADERSEVAKKPIEERIVQLEGELSALRHNLDNISECFGALVANMTTATSPNTLQCVVGKPHGSVSMNSSPPPPSIETTTVMPSPLTNGSRQLCCECDSTMEGSSVIV
eukprot:NODE_481_length_3001_cov_5.643354.p1 GENE.NODE_481_length_3001_cov_5.643354~~NODE_481_length_3001_cov_5.643354.p1  ORF type:complete len:874 (+),score=159.39 NODE_481_length_3001_cov_5.643354:49-2670(+)